MTSHKNKYRFRFRPLAGPPDVDHSTMEAGPFTRDEADLFGHRGVERRVLLTGVTWAVDYAPIEDEDTPTTPWGFVVIFLILVLVSALGYLIDTEVIR